MDVTVSKHQRGVLAGAALVVAVVVIGAVALIMGDPDSPAAPEFLVISTVSDITIGSMTGSCETLTRSRVGDDEAVVVHTGCVVQSWSHLDLQVLLNQASAERMRRLYSQ
jgi:hypothetical protein